MGVLKRINSECSKLLAWSEEELSGKHIHLIMPKVFADHHNWYSFANPRWMKRYFDGGPPTIINNTRYIFALSKLGFVTPCNLLVKVNPYLHNGLEVIGIMTPAESNVSSACTLLVEGDKAIIAGVTQKAYQRYGIHPAFAYGQHPDDQRLSLLELFMGQFDHLNEAIKDDKLCIDGNKLKTSSLLPSHYWRQKFLPERTKHKSNRIRLKIEKIAEASFGVTGLNIIELRLLEIKENYTYLGSVLMKHGSTRSMYESLPRGKRGNPPALAKTKFDIANENEVDADIQSYELLDNGQTALSEDELERLNMKAEKERRLKEQKANLKNKSTSSSITSLYVYSSVYAIASVISVLVIMLIQETRNTYFDLGLTAIFNLNLRASYVPQVAF